VLIGMLNPTQSFIVLHFTGSLNCSLIDDKYETGQVSKNWQIDYTINVM